MFQSEVGRNVMLISSCPSASSEISFFRV